MNHRPNAGPAWDLEIINLDKIMVIQEEIDPNDMVSLMFLLYEEPQTALWKLLTYSHQVSTIGVRNSSILYEWAARAQTRRSWKCELMEALVTCQLNTVIRKLGFHLQTLKQLIQTSKEISFISPLKKILYWICENMNATSYRCFKLFIDSEYNIPDHETREIAFLELMCRKFFTLKENKFALSENVNKLLHILDKIPHSEKICLELKIIAVSNKEANTNHSSVASTSKMSSKATKKKICNVSDLSEEYELLNELSVENLNLNLKSDDGIISHGLCYIINQEKFTSDGLKSRPESAADKRMLQNTMRDHHIEVISHNNLSRENMINSIKSVIEKHLNSHHGIFFLCILSHGTRDYVYSADCKMVNIEEIENMLDSIELNPQLRFIPKVLILEACQIDAVQSKAVCKKQYIKKSNMVTFCSTAPGCKAYRWTGKCSLFIHCLCNIIDAHSNDEHLTDMFTKVTKDIEHFCSGIEVDQLPIMLRNTLLNKIYLSKTLGAVK